MPAFDDKIKKVAIDNTEYEISAKYIQNGDQDMTWNDIKNLVEVGFQIVVLTTLPEANAASYETYHNSIVLIQDSTSTTGSYVEYVIQRTASGSSYTYAWERIGTTDTDLSDYVKKGTYTTGSPSSSGSGYAIPDGENPIESEGAIYDSAANYDTTNAKIYTPIKTSDNGDHTHTATLPVLTQTFSGFYASADRKYLYHTVTGVGSHSHDILVSRNTVVTSWSATVTGEVLSFSMSTTNLPHVVPTESEGGTEWLYTGENGSHYHSLQLATSTTATSPSSTPTKPLQYIEDVAKAPTFTIYYAGVSGATDTMSASVSTTGSHSHAMNTSSYSNPVYYTQWTMPFAIKSHTHNYQHYHSISHTHSVDLTVDPNA